MVNGTRVTPFSRLVGQCAPGLPRPLNNLPASDGWDYRTSGTSEPDGAKDAPVALSMSWNCLTSGTESPAINREGWVD